MSGRLLRIIVLSSLVFVLGVNLVLFTIVQHGYGVHNTLNIVPSFDYLYDYHYNYKGFQAFFDYLETFPGLTNSMLTVNRIAAILSREISYTGYTVLDAIIGILDIMSSPIQLIILFVVDLINNVIWIFSFFIPNYFS